MNTINKCIYFKVLTGLIDFFLPSIEKRRKK